MNLAPHVARLHERLRNLADATTGSQGRSLIERMGPALEPALTLVVLEALTAATRDISDKRSIESVNITPEGIELKFTTADLPPNQLPSAVLATRSLQRWEDDQSVRTTVRLPARLRDAIVSLAGSDGLSANTWIARSLSLAVDTEQDRSQRDPIQSTVRGSDRVSPDPITTSGVDPALDFDPEDGGKEWPSDWIRATLGMVALRVLEAGPSYGYVIMGELAAAGLTQVKEGTLYPLLNRLEDAGLVVADWKPSEDGPARKYLALTDAGRNVLNHQRNDWSRFTRKVADYMSTDLSGKGDSRALRT